VKIASTTITGNCADIIGDALRSVVDRVDLCIVIPTCKADEMQDRTIEVAREVCGEKLFVCWYGFPFEFGKARQFALEVARQQGAEWAVTVDTDERLIFEDRYDLRSSLNLANVDLITCLSEDGSYEKERFIRTDTEGAWVGLTHEYFRGDRGRCTWWGARFREITKTNDEYRAKHERDVRLLTEYVEEHDEARWWFYLGESYRALFRYLEAIASYLNCASKSGWDEEAGFAHYRASECSALMGEFGRGLELAIAGLAYHAEMAELYWHAGWCAYKLGKHQQAIRLSHAAADRGACWGNFDEQRRVGFKHLPALYEGPYDVLRHAYRALGEKGLAKASDESFDVALKRRLSGDGAGAAPGTGSG